VSNRDSETPKKGGRALHGPLKLQMMIMMMYINQVLYEKQRTYIFFKKVA
jgi:hypothetical protein